MQYTYYCMQEPATKLAVRPHQQFLVACCSVVWLLAAVWTEARIPLLSLLGCKANLPWKLPHQLPGLLADGPGQLAAAFALPAAK